ncbi:GroS Co-chaperonin GroES (HSP10) [uncultured Caudovirales phage]|mgnify:CR=1 FL=1|jgi:co-chaperonin GroES (HSP10)|uniref:GroS Co-chaperonin GroES (HSP10) n=1 Tax=uncultured Caudovirales phage TaxID=2100421 RepID=A0A6J5Q7E7_9CAUD|nr:GroS Co-chaperonin GroES (HSP10) [uncultured Caudovirales phage]|tara:strand:+ start:246 stop:644 length:399 start_codon:yes stop_codon:yes gene_type:complete
MSTENIGNIDTEATIERGEKLAERLPEPVGYKLLLIKPKVVDKTASGIEMPDSFKKKEEAGAVVCMVIKVGPMAYMDTEKFPTGPWCTEGDFVLIGAYRGSRFSVDGEEFILVNDDMIEGTVSDPRGIGRVY